MGGWNLVWEVGGFNPFDLSEHVFLRDRNWQHTVGKGMGNSQNSLHKKYPTSYSPTRRIFNKFILTLKIIASSNVLLKCFLVDSLFLFCLLNRETSCQYLSVISCHLSITLMTMASCLCWQLPVYSLFKNQYFQMIVELWMTLWIKQKMEK